MSTLFKKKAPQDTRSHRLVLRVTHEEHQAIKKAAGVRQMEMAEFMRRAALGRKADVDMDTDCILALSEITREVRRLHAAMVERGFPPPEEQLLPVILEARQAILRIADLK